MEIEYNDYLRKRFKKISKIYDILALSNCIRKPPVKLVDIKPETKILDVCTGTGNLALEFAKYSNNVVGIDISSEMLKVANKKNKSGKVKFILMDATKLEFEDKTFDITSISTSLHEMPENVRIEVLKEIKRVTKNKVIVIDYCLGGRKLFKKLVYKIISLYESKYFNEFICEDLRNLISEQRFEIEIEKIVLGIFKIFVCKII
ncbi:MAG: methyltransferase domain-containing protein [Elusimicrobiota bacterium]